VEYDGKSESVIVIWGRVISDPTPQDRQRSTTRGVEDINWGVEPPPGNSHIVWPPSPQRSGVQPRALATVTNMIAANKLTNNECNNEATTNKININKQQINRLTLYSAECHVD